MTRSIIIPPVTAPGDDPGTGSMEVLLTLVDANGAPIPAADVANTGVVHGLGAHTITDSALTLTLSTQSELADETYYRVVVRQGRETFSRTAQVPDGETALTWAQFLGLEDPVTAGLAWAARLLPESPADGQFAIFDEDAGEWIAGSVAPGAGVEEAPVDGTPYARQDAGWVAATGGGAWGSITGTLADQTDLQSALDARALSSSLGTAAFTASSAYATATEGTQGAAAYGWGDHASAGYLTVESDTAALGALTAHEEATDPHPVYRLSADAIPWSDVSGTPTTLDGYGITDAASSAEGDLAASALQPGDINTLAELNALVSDATLIDTGDARLSNARTPTTHASSHATGGADAITPADIGAEPAGVSAADITDSTSIGRAVLTAATKAAARSAVGEPHLPTAAVQMGGTDQVISATAGTSYQITTPWATTASADSSGAIVWNATEKAFDVIANCKLQFSIFVRAVTASAAQSYVQLRDRGGAWNAKLTPTLNSTYTDHTSFGYIKDVLAGQRVEVLLYCGTSTTYTASSNTSVTSLQAQVLSLNA